jgi:hypothetical protein
MADERSVRGSSAKVSSDTHESSTDGSQCSHPAPYCQCIMWRHRDRRCEFWVFADAGRLLVYDGNTLIDDEPIEPGRGWTQAQKLRLIHISDARSRRM